MNGFETVRLPGGTLIAVSARLEELRALGLDAPQGWADRLSRGASKSGRGATAVLELADGSRIRLKQLRRGGLLRGVWRDRFVGRRRPLANLTVPVEARERGLATPRPVALLIAGGPPGLVRAWVAHEEIDGAPDLRDVLSTEWAEAPARSAIRLVRGMHDRGLVHRDLNIGNLVCRREADGSWASWVVDLDGARLESGPLSFGARQRGLRRLERSCIKAGVAGWAGSPLADVLYAWYAADDPSLSRRLDRGRAFGRWLVRIHRVGWRRASS